MSCKFHPSSVQDKGGLIEIHSDEAVEVSSEDDKAVGMGIPWMVIWVFPKIGVPEDGW